MREVQEAEDAICEGREVAANAPCREDMGGYAHVFLTSLANNDEIGLLVSQIGERRPLKRIVDGDSESWVVCRPGLSTPSLPQEIRSMTVLMDMMVEAILPEWIDHLDEDAPDLDGLTPDARVVLTAMRDLGAFCIDARITQDMIRDKTAELGEEIVGTRLGQAISLLKGRLYLDAKSGTATWLTPRGQKAADMVKSPSKSK